MEKASKWITDDEVIELPSNQNSVSNDLQNKIAVDTMKVITQVTDLMYLSDADNTTKRLASLSIPVSAASAAVVAVGMVLRAILRRSKDSKFIDQKDLAEAVAYVTTYLIFRMSSSEDRKTPDEMAALTTKISDTLNQILPEQQFKIIA